MATLTLDLDQLDVSTFETSATYAAPSDSGDTNDEICYALSLLPEDCFGPSAGCTIDTTEA